MRNGIFHPDLFYFYNNTLIRICSASFNLSDDKEMTDMAECVSFKNETTMTEDELEHSISFNRQSSNVFLIQTQNGKIERKLIFVNNVKRGAKTVSLVTKKTDEVIDKEFQKINVTHRVIGIFNSNRRRFLFFNIDNAISYCFIEKVRQSLNTF